MPKSLQRSALFQVRSVLGKDIRTSKRYWKFIAEFKHPELKNKFSKVLETIQKASFVYQDTEHQEIYLYYHKINKHWICAVCKHLNSDGFLVTTYLTAKSKRRGKKVWPKKK